MALHIGDDAPDFSAKDFRTWYATRAAMLALERCEIETKTQARAEVKRVLTEVAKKLGNTPTICRSPTCTRSSSKAFLRASSPVAGRSGAVQPSACSGCSGAPSAPRATATATPSRPTARRAASGAYGESGPACSAGLLL